MCLYLSIYPHQYYLLTSGLEKNQERSPEHLLRVTVSDIPFATHLILKPLSPEFLDIDAKEAFLTRLFPKYHVCLNVGQKLIFESAGVHYAFLVSNISPNKEGSARITDCNVALDFELSPELHEQYKKKRIIQIPLETQIQGSIAAGQAQDFSFLIPNSVDFVATAPLVQLQISEPTSLANTHSVIQVVGKDLIDNIGQGTPLSSPSAIPEPLLLITIPPTRKPTLPNHLWALTKKSSELLLSIANITFDTQHDLDEIMKFMDKQDPRALYMSLHNPTESLLSYTIMITSGQCNASTKAPGIIVTTSSHIPFTESYVTAEDLPGDSGVETTLCPTCGAKVPTSSFTLHSVTCARNNVRCQYPGCNAVLRKGIAFDRHIHCRECQMVVSPETLATHVSYIHDLHTCSNSGCSVSMILRELHAHTTQDCTHRLIQCRYCHDIVKSGGAPSDAVDRFHGLTAHEAECGSKTMVCPYCPTKRAVLLKQWTTHIFMFHPNVPVITDSHGHFSSSAGSYDPAPSQSPTPSISSAFDSEALPIFNPNYDPNYTTVSPLSTTGNVATPIIPSGTQIPSTTPSADVDYDSSKEFSCHACSFVNPLSRTHCEMCSTPHVSKRGSEINLGRDNSTLLPSEMDTDSSTPINSSSSDDFSPMPNSATAHNNRQSKPSLCGNQICSHLTDASSRLCKRCTSHIISFDSNFYPDDSTADAFLNDMERNTKLSLLGSIYRKQLVEGCGRPTCKNPYCLSHQKGAKRMLAMNEAVVSELCDELVAESGNQKYFLCQGDNARFIVTGLPTLDTKLEVLFRPAASNATSGYSTTDSGRSQARFVGTKITTSHSQSRTDPTKKPSASSRISRAFF